MREETKLKGGTVLNRLLEPILKEGGIEEDNSLQDKTDELAESLTSTADIVSEDLTERMQSHMADIDHIEINPGPVSLSKAISPTISIKDEYIDQSVDIAERGSGVGSLLILSLMQTYVEMQVGEGYCLLFEEPGNFLHPAAERKMLSALKEIANEGQVCISTHSQAMIDQERDASMHVVRRESGETSFQLVEEDTFAIIDEIGARNSDLLQSDFVIYVEGPSDIAILNEIARHVISDWGSCNVVIQHLGGTGSLVHCDPEKLEKINRKFALLLDSDQKCEGEGPKKEVRDIKSNFDEYDKMCDVLDRREIENYYSHESINEICYVSVDESFVGEYDDIEKKLKSEMDDGYSFDKLKHGREIVDHMYQNGESIQPVEELLRDCVQEAQRG
ncbi:ATP-dependent endonuclease of the OLD family- like protein [Halococcus saccharolyticus DSM 5350]|uniref:ATP-dependent endonuclease of the OLD family-like protein n=1 Tax=Halococcus saccharolyticus DSM 5350 TaxID=1227455 RepID=M0MCE8_9EURY|nr:ATP-dependent endonuclease of the OLD family- like protein [Halococcus saccharolyticus DSM 5350]